MMEQTFTATGNRAPSLPSFLRTLVAVLPRYPGSVALALGLNALLRDRLPAEVMAALEGRIVAIELTDLNFELVLGIVGHHFVPERSGAVPAMCFRATTYDFATIAAGEEDADALFFRRRLVMEGDTELALTVKNALDAVDAPLVRKLIRTALKLAAPLGG